MIIGSVTVVGSAVEDAAVVVSVGTVVAANVVMEMAVVDAEVEVRVVWTAEEVVSETGTVVSAVEIFVDRIFDDVLSAVVPDVADPQAVAKSITHSSARLWNM